MPIDISSVPGGRPAPSLTWRGAQRLVRPMTSEELVAALATTTGTRRVPVEAPLTSAVLLAGIEIAVTRPSAERTLRRLWRDRRGGGATPLLLLADDPRDPGVLPFWERSMPAGRCVPSTRALSAMYSSG